MVAHGTEQWQQGCVTAGESGEEKRAAARVQAAKETKTAAAAAAARPARRGAAAGIASPCGAGGTEPTGVTSQPRQRPRERLLKGPGSPPQLSQPMRCADVNGPF